MASNSGPRVGVVLGAGGLLGGAWLAGALYALSERTGYQLRSADYLVGTSAGAVFAALASAGVPPWMLIPEQAGRIYHGRIGDDGVLQLTNDLWEPIGRRRWLHLPALRPGSWRLLTSALQTPSAYAMLKLISGLAPTGVISTDPIKEAVRWAVAEGWSKHPATWIVAADYHTGERVVFGQPGAPKADLAEAVAASCAIPGFYCPEKIDGRFYVDGGVHSMTNADLLLDAGLDLVIMFSPLSSRARFRGWNPLNRFTDVTRRIVGPYVDAEVEALRADGAEVLLVEPTPADLAAIGGNLMDGRRRQQVMNTAVRTTAEQFSKGPAARLLGKIGGAPMPVPKAARARLAPKIAS